MAKIAKYLKPFRWWIAGALVLLLLQSLAELYLPTLMSSIVDIGIAQGNTGFIWRTGAIMLVVAAGSALSTVLGSYLSSKASMGFGRDLREAVFTHVEGFSLNEFNQLGTATLITRTTNDITQVQQVLIMALRMMIMAPIMAVGGVIMAVSQDAQLSLVILVAIPLLAGLVGFVAAKGIPLFKSIQTKLDKLNLVLREGLTGIRVIRAFNRTDYEQTRFTAANRDLTNTAIQVNRLMAFMMPMIMILMNFTTIAVIWFGAIRIDQGNLQVGSLMAFIQYITMIMFSLIMLSMMFIMIPRAQASVDRINEVMDLKPSIHDNPQALTDGTCRGCVEFRNVSFGYQGAEDSVLCDVSFEAHPGEVTAIIGGTGSGKSTLIQLIPRFYEVNAGSVLVDGVDVRDYTQDALRAKIGFVPQQAVLFSGTVEENIRYGKEDASQDEIRHAAEVAQAVDFIDAMPEGYQAELAQGGTNLSGGQKQRLSIARALVRRPEIYIFDDSFSALDFKTDARLRAALRQEITEATVIIVAQRVSTVLDADRIIVLEDGQIAGIGNHKELLKSCEVYREIVSSQLSEEEMA
jgi:ATP-binding cassette subfamily B protein